MNQLKTLLIIPILSLFLFAFNTKNMVKTTQKQVQLLTEELIIKGTVTDTNNNPIKGGLVLNRTKSGVITNKEGVYAIKIKKGDVLTFSYKGMILQKITVTNDSPINLTLKKNPDYIEQIIEVPKTKKHLINIDGKSFLLSLEDIDPNKIQSMNVITSENAKSKYGPLGKSGVIEIKSKTNESAVIKSIDDKEPLIVIDGEISSKKTENLAPNEIQSMSVLSSKAAIKQYGDKGKNGVIEITTKKKK